MTKLPLRNFFRNPEKTGFSISPDAEFISYLAPYKNRLNIHINKRGSDDSRRITSDEERDISSYIWKNNKQLIYLQDKGGDENHHLYLADIEGSGIIDLTPFEGVKAGILDKLEDNDDEMLILLNKRNPQLFDVYRLNIQTRELTEEVLNPGKITSWDTDHEGRVRLAFQTDGVNTTLLHRKSEEEPFSEVITTNFKESLSPIFFDFDNKNFYALSNLGRDKSEVVLFDPLTASEIKLVFKHDEVDAGGLGFSRKRKVITTAHYTTWKTFRHFFDEISALIYEKLESELPGKEIYITAKNKAEDIFIVRTLSDRSLGDYYLYNHKEESLTHIANVSPWLKEDDLAEMKAVSYKSRDGLTIHAYLTLPRGVGSKNLPVVVNPHGGPWVRDVWGWNPEVQFLANRGMAVLQVNYRGSTGYGKKFWTSSFREWGKKMQDDVSDGVKWLIEEGIANPAKVAIYGGSYGGYCTLAGLTFTPELYACGVDYVGVSNLFTFLNTIPPYWKPYLEMMYEMVGHPERDKELLESSSPVFHVDNIKAPLLVAQGARDPRVAKAESDQIVNALKKKGVEIEYIVKENEGHGFRNEENRFEFYETMEKFLSSHLNN